MRFRLRNAAFLFALAIYISFFFIYFYVAVDNVTSENAMPSSHVSRNNSQQTSSKSDDFHLPLANNSDLKSAINKLNAEQRIRNYDKFGKLSAQSVIVIVQVHNRAYYLKQLIDSLRNAQGIEDILLIFSHDLYNDEINELIGTISFCRVLQIFYPWSRQLYSNVFPGQDPNDCPRDIDKQKAIEMQCNNALFPDSYGHYREAAITQTKHHWWWKINRVMDALKATKDHNGLFLFLEEDHYVSKDFLHMLHLMHQASPRLCPQCNILTVGNYENVAKITSKNQAQQVQIGGWVSSKHNMAMAMSRNTWNSIRSCASQFCNFDDYNWDWTLQHLSTTCMSSDEQLVAMMPKIARVFHIGQCGIHHKGKDCNSAAVVQTVKNMLQQYEPFLFNNRLQVWHGTLSNRHVQPPKPNGGWGDGRDRELCMSFVQ